MKPTASSQIAKSEETGGKELRMTIINDTANDNQNLDQLIKEYDERQKLIDDINKYHGTSKEPKIEPAKAIGIALKHLITPNPHHQLQIDEETVKMLERKRMLEQAAEVKNLSKEA